MEIKKQKMFQLSEIKLNPKNPRLIQDAKFKKLVKSIEAFPDMMAMRPIIIDENNMNLGGNMRYRALLELGYTEVPAEWVKKVTNLTEDQKQEFIVKDNVSFGEWDWEILTNEWDIEKLDDWDVDVQMVNDSKTPDTKPKSEELRPYVKTHILLSFPPEKILQLKPFLDEILKLEFIEYEQSSN